MKAFYIIIIICTIAVIGTLANSIYVRRFSEEARLELKQIDFDSESAAEQVEAFSSYTKEHLKRIEFSIPRNKSDEILNHLSSMLIQQQTQNRHGFELSRVLLDNLLEEIAKLEEISFENLL